MPQMSPLFWLFMYVFFSFSLYFFYVIIWFFINKVVVKKDKVMKSKIVYLNKW